MKFEGTKIKTKKTDKIKPPSRRETERGTKGVRGTARNMLFLSKKTQT